jgi:Ca2+-binding RTX toxin-like protein
MRFLSFFQGLIPTALRPQTKRGQACRPRGPCRSLRTIQLAVETLEDRCLLSFSPAVNYPVERPMDMIVGDVNRDGKADLVTINNLAVTVQPGQGDGTFGAAQTTAVAGSLRAVAAGDFNGDGRLDLVFSTITSVLVLLNNTATVGGPVTFQAARNFSTGTSYFQPGVLAVGDFNRDGKLDVAVTAALDGNSDLVVFQGDGVGNLRAARAVSVGWSPSVAVGDLNGDGRLDVVTANWYGRSAAVLINAGNDAAGNVQFQPVGNVAVAGGPDSVAVGDFNNDGRMDLAATSETTTVLGSDYYGPIEQIDGYVNVLLGHGDGTFDPTQTTWTGNTDPGTLATGDFNGDGKLDVATADSASDVLIVRPGAGDGTFSADNFYEVGYVPGGWGHPVLVGNFNGDTFPDVAVANYQSKTVSVLLNTGDAPLFQVSGFPWQTAGQDFPLSFMAVDSNGNPLPSYTGTVHFSSSDPQADLPADYTFTAADNGLHIFTATLKTAGAQWVAATDTAMPLSSGRQDVSVTPAKASALVIGGFPSPVTAGDSSDFNVSAYDTYGNLATYYYSTLHFASSDAQAVLPDDSPFYYGGMNSFSAVLQTVGTQSITVTDVVNPSLTATLSGIQVLPGATLSGPAAGLRNQVLSFTLGASGGTSYRYDIDWNGDGVVDQTVTGPDGLTVQHSYSTSGSYRVGVAATVHVGAADYTSFVTSQSVAIFAVTATVQADPGDATRSALVVEGTTGSDYLTLSPGAGNAIALSVSGYPLGSYSAPGGAAFAHLLVYSYGGDDTIGLAGGLAVPALLFGGDGNDTLDASGSSANNVLVGGSDNDLLYGGNSHDLLIGSLGADTLRAGGAAILIGGTTDYDANVQALLAITKEWGRTDVDYTTRVKHLQGTLAGGQNGSYRLTATTVHADSVADSLFGGAGMDWYFVSGSGKKNQDKVYNQASGEVITTL